MKKVKNDKGLFYVLDGVTTDYVLKAIKYFTNIDISTISKKKILVNKKVNDKNILVVRFMRQNKNKDIQSVRVFQQVEDDGYMCLAEIDYNVSRKTDLINFLTDDVITQLQKTIDEHDLVDIDIYEVCGEQIHHFIDKSCNLDIYNNVYLTKDEAEQVIQEVIVKRNERCLKQIQKEYEDIEKLEQLLNARKTAILELKLAITHDNKVSEKQEKIHKNNVELSKVLNNSFLYDYFCEY